METRESHTSFTERRVSDVTFSLSGKRWVIICIYGFMNMANSMMWVSFSPISDLTTDFFDHATGQTGTNMLPLVYSIFYLPGSVFSAITTKKHNIRIALLISAVLTTIGSLLRVLGVALKEQDLGNGSLAYIITMLGQILSALAQPFFMNIPAALASTWFNLNERDFATAVASMCNPLGNAIGQLLPPFFVYNSSDYDDDENASVSGMFLLMVVQFSWALLGLMIAYFFFDAAPINPPSASTLLKRDGTDINRNTSLSRAMTIDKNINFKRESGWKNGEDSNSLKEDLLGIKERQSSIILSSQEVHREREDSIVRGDHHSISASYQTLKEEVKKLFDIRDYRILFFAISFGLGTFNTLIALLNQLVENYDYSNDDAGNFGALLIVFGIFFSGVTGYILDVTHKYKEALKIFFVAGCFSLLFWLSSIYHNNLTTLCIASTILGSFVVPLIPIVTECTAEVTYPISEDISVGILLVGGNYISIFMTLLVQWLIDQVPLGPPPFLPSSILLFVALLVSTISVLFFEGDYKRLKVDQVSSSPSS